MCGITGIFHLDGKIVNKKILEKFTLSLFHRGPDGIGYYYDQENNLGLGHTRLKILDITDLSNQPFLDSSKRYSITYNGEIYNYLELKDELQSKGYKFKTTGDTEVVLNSFIEWGENCNYKFNGMWAFAIWDNKMKKLFLSRDRFGVKPLYYMRLNNSVFFSSELKSFKCLEKEKPEINYGIFSSVHKDFNREDTFLKNVFLLGPGHQLEISKDNKIIKKKWWKTIEHIPKISKSYNDQVEQFRQIFFDSCKIRSRSDVHVSTSLSGGLDSSSIVCTLDYLKDRGKISSEKFHNSYVLNYLNEKNSETFYAKEVINNTKSIPTIINLEKKSINLDEFIKISYHQEMISGDDGLGPWSVYKRMNENNIKVSLDGHGPDELFGGYRDVPAIASNLTSWINIVRKIKLRKLGHEMNSDRNFYKHIFIKMFDKIKNKKTTSLKKKKYFYYNDENPQYNEYDDINNLDLFNQYLYKCFHYMALQKVLLKFDKLSMANSIESRCPFLDWRLVTFLFALPPESKIDENYTKKILRDSMIDINPPLINKRIYKKGFDGNIEWYVENYKEYIDDIVKSKKFLESNIFDGKKILNDYDNKKILDIKNLFLYIQAYIIDENFK